MNGDEYLYCALRNLGLCSLVHGRSGGSCHAGLPLLTTTDQDVSIEALMEKLVTDP